MISSTSNPKVKRLLSLQKKKRFRDEEQVFLVEGIRMFREIPEAHLKEIYVTEACYKKEKELVDEKKRESGAALEVLADSVFAHVSDTKTPQGLLAVVSRVDKSLTEILGQSAGAGSTAVCEGDCIGDPEPADTRPGGAKAGERPLLVVLDNLQDPGNLGTIFRSAEAAGATGIILSSDCVDIYNPKTVRSTMGAIFRMPFFYTEDLIGTLAEMKARGIRTFAAHLDRSVSYEEMDYRGPAAFLIGNEGNGLRREIADAADAYIHIPMAGKVESLNAAIAATILLFETARQRIKEE